MLVFALSSLSCIHGSFNVSELNKNDADEIKQVCALFEDEKNAQQTMIDPEYMLRFIENNRVKAFVCKTQTVPPVVTGVLTCVYMQNGLDKYAREIEWNHLTPRYKRTERDAFCYATIAIHPAYRRCGIATALMQRADKFCAGFGMNKIVISAYKSNNNAINC